MKTEMINPMSDLLRRITDSYNATFQNKDMQMKFAQNLDYKEGRKYIKILNNKSVWGFIVNVENDPMFKYGDVLKPAGYNTPARNVARANIFDRDSVFNGVSWTGPNYL